jgi:hypothetical protein
MSRLPDPLIPTRRSLLNRLKNWEDQDSWEEFFNTYWRLIYRTALRRSSQVVRQGSAKPLCVGSIPTSASKVTATRLLPLSTWYYMPVRFRILPQRDFLAHFRGFVRSRTDLRLFVPQAASVARIRAWGRNATQPTPSGSRATCDPRLSDAAGPFFVPWVGLVAGVPPTAADDELG